MDIDEYCREIEAHLCRRNAGHLVRVVGPAFDMVRHWAARGIPLKVAMQGIDRVVDRAAAKGTRRRPIRVEFCEADVLDAFEAWRRAVGVRADSGAADTDGGDGAQGGDTDLTPRRRSRESLATQLDRVIVRLTALRTGAIPPAWDAALDEAVRRLDAWHPASRRARGEARERILADLAAVDVRLLDAARASAPAETLAFATGEAALELEPFRPRLAPEAFAAAHRRCVDRHLRAALHLPDLILE